MHQPNSTDNCRTSFPVKLYTMLELFDGNATSNTGRSEIVAWRPHGRAFEVRDEERFMSEVSPLFFRQTKINSFYRQLHLWGFRRFSKGKDVGSWYNSNFLRGQPGQLKKMLRIKIKKTVGVEHARSRPEPDLYSLPPLVSANRPNLLHSKRNKQINRSNSSPPRPQQVPANSTDNFKCSNFVGLGYSRRNSERRERARRSSLDSFAKAIGEMEFNREIICPAQAPTFGREIVDDHAQASVVEPLPMHQICTYEDMAECVEVIDRALRL